MASDFYLEPLYTADGLPDFDDLKKMLSYLEKLNRDGHILSMLPTGTDLLAALGRMSGEAVVEYLRRDHIPSRIGGLLVETDIHIQGTLIAKTERKAPAPKPVEE